MSRKGFSLIELIITIAIIAIIGIIAMKSINSTLSVSKNEAYKLMKNNMLKAAYNYVNECRTGVTECDLSFQKPDVESNEDESENMKNKNKDKNNEQNKSPENSFDTTNDNEITENKNSDIKSENITFKANTLRTNGYFKNLESPIDGKDLGECLLLEVAISNGVVTIDLIDNCYL